MGQLIDQIKQDIKNVQSEIDAQELEHGADVANLQAEIDTLANTINDIIDTLPGSCIVLRIPSTSAAEVFELSLMAGFSIEGSAVISSVSLIPDETIPADGVNYLSLEVINTGTDGLGVDSVVSIDFDVNNALQYNNKDLGTIITSALNKDEVLTVKKTVTGSGAVSPEMSVVIKFDTDF